MPLPVSVLTGTVIGTFLALDGTPLNNGTITFRPSAKRLLALTEPATILPGVVVASTNVAGVLIGPDQPGVELAATDNINVEPVDWTWEVTLDFGARQWGPGAYKFAFELPASDIPVDLTTVTPVPASNGTFIPGTGGPEPSTVDFAAIIEGGA